jgi:hypothetical protein
VKFLCDSIATARKYNYTIAQSYADSVTLLGGENLIVSQSIRVPFNANAGPDKYVFPGDSVLLQAEIISEPAIYEWYINSTLIHRGANKKVLQNTNAKYTLKVTSVTDGSIDYDDMEVKMKSGIINNIYPNPTSNSTTVNYTASNVDNVSLLLIHPYYLNMATYTLDPSQTSISIDMSLFPTGTYSFILLCDGNMQDAKSIIKL